MPVIQVYKRQVSIPSGGANALGNVGGAGVVGDALAQGGSQLFNDAIKSIQKQKEEKEGIDLIKQANEWSAKESEYEITARTERTGEAAFNITRDAKADLENLMVEHLKNVPDELKQKSEFIIRRSIGNSLDRFTTHEINQKNVYRADTIKNTVDLASNLIVSHADNPMDIDNTIADTIAKLESLKMPQSEINKVSSGLISVAVEANANNGNFGEAEALIEKNKTILDAHGTRDTLINMVQTKVKQAKILAAEQKEEVLSALNKDFQAKYLDGKLNVTEVTNSNLSEPEKKEWLDQLKTIPVSFKTDKDFEMKLWEKIMVNPESVGEKEIMKFAGHGLSMEDAKSLISLRDKQINGDPERKEAIKSVLSELRIDKAEGVFGNKEYLHQVDTFKKWVKVHPNEPPETYREKILAPRKMTKVQEWLDWIPFVNPSESNPKKTREEIEAELKSGAKPATAKPKTAPKSNLPAFEFDIKDKAEQKKVLNSIESGKVPVRIQINPKYPNKKRIVYKDGTYDEFTVGG